MIKNVSGQKVGAQMVSATDGSAFTGSVTVEVTIDAGSQATGSVGSGACTHEGNGYHTYAPSQAETNGDLVAFTFHGTGAVPQTVQVYTRAATPDVNVTTIEGSDATNQIRDAVVDDSTRIDASALNTLSGHDPGEAIMGATDLGTGAGLTSLASAANLATLSGYVDTEVAAILADTNELQTDLTDGGRLDLILDAINAKTTNLPSDPADASVVAGLIAGVEAKVDTVDTVVDAIKAVTDELPDAGALTSLAQGSDLATVDGNVDSILADTNELQGDWANGGRLDLLIDAIKAVTDVLISPATIATAVWSAGTRLLTAGTNIVLAKGTGVTGLNDLDAGGVRSAVGLASADLDTQLDAIAGKLLVAYGTAAGAGTGADTLQLETGQVTAVGGDGSLNDKIVSIVAGAGKGQNRAILATDESDNEIQIDGGAWEVAVDNTSVFIIYSN